MSDDRARDRRDHQRVDALSEAEELRSQLQEALARAGRLVAALKRQRKQRKVVQAAVQSLRKLRGLGE
jgi:hypothetical protein